MKIPLRSPDELIAALPHMFGFEPQESLVLLPLAGADLPRVRIDIPTTPSGRDQMWDSISLPYSRQTQPGYAVAVICLTHDRHNAEITSTDLKERLRTLGIFSPIRLWADDKRWADLDTGESDLQTQDARNLVEAEMVANGIARPARSRADLAASLIGDRTPIAAILPTTRAELTNSTRRAELTWTCTRLYQFHTDGNKLNDHDAARMLLAMQSIGIRDAMWDDMRRDTALSHVAIWTDLTRRAPDDVRAAPAALAGFANWLAGDGARALCALDQVPPGRPYPLADLLAKTIQIGLHPREWDRISTAVRNMPEIEAASSRRPPTPEESIDRQAPGL